jgi:hypothetical protein
MSSFAVTKAPAAPVKVFKGLHKAARKGKPLSNLSRAKEMMVWTPIDNKCVPVATPGGCSTSLALAVRVTTCQSLPSRMKELLFDCDSSRERA